MGREQTAWLLSKENHDLLGIAALPGAHVKSFNEGQVFTRANAVEVACCQGNVSDSCLITG